MFRLLIAYDASPCSEAAIFDLKRMGLPRKSEVKILSVADVRVPSDILNRKEKISSMPSEFAIPFEKAVALGKEELKKMEGLTGKAKNRLTRDFPAWDVSTQVLAGSPARSIIAQAKAWNADLLLMGSHNRTAAGRLFLGSVSTRVLEHAPCSVHVARGSAVKKIAPVRLVVGVDGSTPSDQVVDRVASRHWTSGSSALVVTVSDARILTAAAFDPKIKVWVKKNDVDATAWVMRMIKSYEKKLTTSGLITSSLIKEGEPKKTLLQEAERWGADCIFIGSRGLGVDERLMLGSVSSALATRAHCSVEIVRWP